VLEERGRGKVGGSDVGVEAERLSELEETLFGSDGPDTPFGTSDRACDD
jgi:hypothetical protein